VLAAALLVSGAAFAGDDASSSSNSDGFWGRVFDKLDMRTRVGPMPDFVEKTRPDASQLKFIPTSTPHPKGAIPVKSADEVEAAKEALDAARDAQLAPPAPAAAKPKKPRAAKPKQAAGTN
jgi:hypothetical protein